MADDNSSRYGFLGFFSVFIILLNLFSIPFGESFIKNADFVETSPDLTNDYSGSQSNIFTTLDFMLFADVPDSSNISGAITVYRFIYWIIFIPSLIIISVIILELLLSFHIL